MTNDIETGEFSFANHPDNVRVIYGPSVTIFEVKYSYPVGVYQLPGPIWGCTVKIIYQGKWKITAIIRDIATDHTTTIEEPRDFMGRAIENVIRKCRRMTDWEYLTVVRKHDWLPDGFMGGKQAERYTALCETYTTIYSKDNSCWVYNSENHQSPLYRSDTKPSFGHFREFVILSIAPLDKDDANNYWEDKDEDDE